MSQKKRNRRQRIVELTLQQKSVVVDDLAETLGVSAQTVRRDINHLCDINILRRRHGGAEVFETEGNTPYDQRAATNPSAKRAIAVAAAGLIPDGSTIAISVGTTPMMVAEALGDKKSLTVITNNMNAAMALGREASNRIILPGGELRLPDLDFVGDHVVDFFGSYRTDFGVFGVGGVAGDGGLLDFQRSEVRIREKIKDNSKLVILVLDHTKFGRSAPAVGGEISGMDRVILDMKPQDDFAALLDGLGDRLILAGGALQ
ncbi:MAG: DeoR/GlpR family DNA-binding transcription regulator [Rhodobacter sp.]|jgi:DeoR family transcriptional regulator, glycerol-3-phosphate regulon repressor|nr:DeoR/GlpR family DNA-binding transcription regulator [Rhodobacter sp.]